MIGSYYLFLNFLRSVHTVFYNCYTNFYFQTARSPFPPCPCQHLFPLPEHSIRAGTECNLMDRLALSPSMVLFDMFVSVDLVGHPMSF